MFNRLLIAVVFLAVLVGIVGGGLMGGVAGYLVASNGTLIGATAPRAELTAAQSNNGPAALSNVTVNQDSTVTDVVKKAEPAVVTIVDTMQVQSRRFGTTQATAEGSGIIIDAQGHIVTNAHVVQGGQQIKVIFSDGAEANATLVGADTNNDVAVLQVSGKVPAFLSFGDSSSVQVGQSVIAIGNPLGNYQGSVSVGVVSGLNRSVQGSGLNNLIQTDAAINHGDSGGPLLNLSGQVVGINTLVVQNTDSGDLAQGLGFAIPSNTVSRIAQQIIAQGGSTP